MSSIWIENHSQACSETAQRIWIWFQERKVHLTITYLPGKLTAEADEQSRKFSDQTEWKLNPNSFKKLLYKKVSRLHTNFICLTSKCSTVTIDFLETNPEAIEGTCLHNKVEQVERDSCVRISTFQSNPQGNLQAPTNLLKVSSNDAVFDSKIDVDTEGQRNSLIVKEM